MADQAEGLSQHWGAEPVGNGDWQFAFWSPSAREVLVALDGAPDRLLQRAENGTFRGRFAAREGMPYDLIVDELRMADPASRQQARGVTGSSLLVDPARLSGPAGPARALDEAVIAEIHIGSFTPEGTFAAAARAPQLKRLADLGITMIELMPLGQFPGRHGWGYDVILPFAPHHAYGPPEDLRLLVDSVHHLGMQVCLDVVFNHFGPEDCALVQACPEFFHDHSNAWGRAIDYTRPEVRDYFTGCAIWWVETYGIDALRFDAIHAMDEDGPGMIEHLARRIRAHPFGRTVHLIAEDDRNVVHPYLPESRLFHAVWNDDYHHAQHVLLTGESFDYYEGYRVTALEDMARALREGFALQGQPRAVGEVKGEPSSALPPQSFVAFNLNHDHAGNRPAGDRLISRIGAQKAMVAHALLLTAPSIPLLFMGEEIGSEAPFPWFADYAGDLAETLRRERAKQFKAPEAPQDAMVDPFDPAVLARACPYTAPAPNAEQWEDLTRRLTKLRGTLLPIWRSGRCALPEVVTAPPSALSARFSYAAGTITSVALFGKADALETAQRPAPLFRLGQPDRPPFFGLWLDPPSSD